MGREFGCKGGRDASYIHAHMIAYLQPEWQSTAVRAYVSISQSIERVWATCVIIFSVEKSNQRTKVDSGCILSARLLVHDVVGEGADYRIKKPRDQTRM